MSERCTLEDVLAVIAPGESVFYVDLIERLKAAGRPTDGVGGVLEPFRRDRYRVLVAWMRERYWDDEVEGGWAESSLWIARRPRTSGDSGAVLNDSTTGETEAM